MFSLLWLVPALPLAGFLVLVLIGSRLPKLGVALVGVGSIGLSAIVAIIVSLNFLTAPPPGHAYTQALWTWMNVGGFTPRIAFYLDALSVVMILVVTVVAFFIHLYSSQYMAEDEGYNRFFAYMNLFVASMLTLVLADNLLLLYLGWEGVGLCSYLLIGFWYKETKNGQAAIKAFVVTRVGDAAMAVGLFLLFTHLGTLDIQILVHRALRQWPVGSGLAVAAAALLLGGAVGKSAQLPLQTWLPDAMAGPTPVSALIHAATMVTAGVYLIARMQVIFTLAPIVLWLVAIIGAVTLVLSGFSAMTQWDIKRVLAYSTISQIGYMFLALGVGAWSAAIFHFMTHAFFKSLLFLGAGVVITSLHDEHDIHKMGGLRREMPTTFWPFLIGACSLSALPLITAGFYSKDLILSAAWGSPIGGAWLWIAGLVGAFLTSIYSFRMVFLTFFGPVKQKPSKQPGWPMVLPLVVLAAFSIVGGFIELPKTMGHFTALSDFLHSTFAPYLVAQRALQQMPTHVELWLQIVAAAASLLGIYLAYVLWLRRPAFMAQARQTPALVALHRFWLAGWGFDWLYDRLFVGPYVWFARTNRRDFIDGLYAAVGWLTLFGHREFSRTQTGRVRWYAFGLAAGAIVLMAIVVWR